MKKIAVITGTRAEFGLLRPLLDKLGSGGEAELQLIVTAMHLSPEFGLTVKEIEDANFIVSKKVECLMSSDTGVGVAKTMGVAMIGLADAFNELSPDLLVILGDRTELLSAAATAMVQNIPVAHIHGGETTQGAYDESIRHALTKMSYLHFTSTETYKRRVIQLGESPERVFNVGAMSIDAIKNLNLLSREDFEESIGFRLGKKTILVTYHPVTLERDTSADQFNNILAALESMIDIRIIFTHANSDKNGRIINQMIQDFVKNNPEKAVDFQSLGHFRYVSALAHIDAVVGNSSSGIVEVPFFGIPTVNIGDRQKGRVAPKSVIHSSPSTEDIRRALEKAFDPEFKNEIKQQEQLFGKGDAAEKIYQILMDTEIKMLKKEFHDLD